MKSQRQLQIGENIKRIMSEIFLRQDYTIMMNNVITILRVDVSPDAKNAKIFIDIFGDSAKHSQILEKIANQTPYFRHLLAQKIDLRNIPEINFIQDKNLEKASEIQFIIDNEIDKSSKKTSKKPNKSSDKIGGKK